MWSIDLGYIHVHVSLFLNAWTNYQSHVTISNSEMVVASMLIVKSVNKKKSIENGDLLKTQATKVFEHRECELIRIKGERASNLTVFES